MNIALGIEYSGTHYCGWQRQTHSPSVQQTLENVLSEIADHEVQVYCAGRTDTGVHATGQVVNFQLNNQRPLKAWTMGANTLLPDDISVVWAQEVEENFHARHSAVSRRYRYVIQNTSYPSATLSNRVLNYRQELNHENMHIAAQSLLGEQSFASFQSSSCQSPTPFRCVHETNVIRLNEFVIIEIQANAFLHHMVRNIVGCLLEVGVGNQDINYVKKILSRQDRTQAPMTAKAHGLYLVRVGYPEKYAIPQLPLGPMMLPDNLSD
ncbi:MAG: tRNA pseudouridine(38-40) synthase TruA [Gammaproteobacteria bacterium]|nr:tRNA pseudouridine(38-40) synthase TruA [Gammaproteobacteria bacterium]